MAKPRTAHAKVTHLKTPEPPPREPSPSPHAQVLKDAIFDAAAHSMCLRGCGLSKNDAIAALKELYANGFFHFVINPYMD